MDKSKGIQTEEGIDALESVIKQMKFYESSLALALE